MAGAKVIVWQGLLLGRKQLLSTSTRISARQRLSRADGLKMSFYNYLITYVCVRCRRPLQPNEMFGKRICKIKKVRDFTANKDVCGKVNVTHKSTAVDDAKDCFYCFKHWLFFAGSGSESCKVYWNMKKNWLKAVIWWSFKREILG